MNIHRIILRERIIIFINILRGKNSTYIMFPLSFILRIRYTQKKEIVLNWTAQ